MRISIVALAIASLFLAGCETTDDGGTGTLTHSHHPMTAAQRAAVAAGMTGYLGTPVTVSGLKASYRLDDGSVAVCGYVHGTVAGQPTPPAIFAGTLASAASTTFVPQRIPGKGQDAGRIAAVRAFCASQHVGI